MKTNKKPLLTLALVALCAPLLSCAGGDDTNTSSKGGTAEEENISINSALSLLSNLNEEEKENAVSVSLLSKEIKNDAITETSETFTIGKDYSSNSEGTIKKSEGDLLKSEDSFLRRRAIRKDTVLNGNLEMSVNRLYMVTDYAKNNIKAEDEANVYFTFDSDADADAAGIEDYIDTEDAKTASGAMGIGILHDTIASQILNDTSFSTQEDAYFKKAFQSDGSWKYTFNASYETDGDLNDTIESTVAVTFNVLNDQLTSYVYQYDVYDTNKTDASDVYHTQAYKEGTFQYGDRGDLTPSLTVDDYFLADVTEVALYSTGVPSKGNEIENPLAIPGTTNYISGQAKTYAPSKAVDLTLYPYKSSASSVIKLEDDIFTVKKEGTSTLSFLYVGKEANGKFAYKEVKVNVKVLGVTPTEFIIVESSNYQDDNTFYIGQTYTFDITARPEKSEQDYTFEVSDPAALTVTKDGKTITIVPQKEATGVTLTIKSLATNGLSKTYTYDVKKDPTDDYKAYLTSHTFDAYKRLIGSSEVALGYGYCFLDLTFYADGSGEVTYAPYDKDTTEIGSSGRMTWTFTYSVFLAKITFDNFLTSGGDYDSLAFETGIIKNDGARIEIDDAVYKTYIFQAK